MNKTKQWQKAVFSAFALYALLLNSFTGALAQGDIQSSDDIAGGSSVFVFRQSSRAAQVKFAARNTARRNNSEREKSRRNLQSQASRAAPRRPKPKAVDPALLAKVVKPKTSATPKQGNTNVSSPSNEATRAQTSEMLAGAAETYLEQGKFDDAIEYFNQAIELNSANQTAKLGLSEAYTKKADQMTDKTNANGAVSLYTEAVKLNPQNAAAFAGLGATFETLEQRDRALENYEKALAINAGLTELYAPIGIIYYQQGNIPRADEFLIKAVAAKTENAETQYFLGLVRYKQERNEEAIAALVNATKTDAQNADAFYYLGEVYDRLNRDDEAAAQYKKAVAVNPRYAEAWFDLGVASYNRERYEEAAAAYTEALKIKNDNAEAHANLADAYRQMAVNYNRAGDFQKRTEYYGKAEGSYRLATVFMERKPLAGETPQKVFEPQEKAEVYSKYGFVLARLGKWNGVIAALNQAVAVNPDAVDYSNLGWAYYNAAKADTENRRESEARAKLALGKTALQQALALSKSNKTVQAAGYMNLGVTLSDLGEFQAAVEAFKNCVAIREKWLPAYNEMGLAYRGMNNLDDAVKAFRRTTEIDDKFTAGWYNLGETEYQRGNTKEAKKAYEKLKKLDPRLANQLDLIMRGAVLKKASDKIQQNNPLNKVPRLPY